MHFSDNLKAPNIDAFNISPKTPKEKFRKEKEKCPK